MFVKAQQMGGKADSCKASVARNYHGSRCLVEARGGACPGFPLNCYFITTL